MQDTLSAMVEIGRPLNTFGYGWIPGFFNRYGHLDMSLEQHFRARPDLSTVTMDGKHHGTSSYRTLTPKARTIDEADLIAEGKDDN